MPQGISAVRPTNGFYLLPFGGSFGMFDAEVGGNTLLIHVRNILPVGTA